MMIGLGHYLTVGAILFTLGILGIFLNRKNIIVILMSIELILLAVNINLVAFSTSLGDIVGQVFALLVLTVAAAEAAIGLAVLVVYFRNRGSIAVEDVNLMKGYPSHGPGHCSHCFPAATGRHPRRPNRPGRRACPQPERRYRRTS
jgi:NADH-quinone oxidoreductase subunit K